MDFKTKLQACETPGEMLNLILLHFDLNMKLGLITKTAFVNGLMQALKMLNAKPK
jgi:hypothetical protein